MLAEELSPAARALHRLLPQTQCQRCGYPDCASYAQAIAQDDVPINQCPPGGDDGVQRLASATGKPVIPINPAFGRAQERTVAFIDEDWCIGCTLCIKACPVDCIIGSNKQMHTIIESQCTGCELCIPACPVDCIEIEIVTPGQTGWQAWSQSAADEALNRYEFNSTIRNKYAGEKANRLEKALEGKLLDLPAASRITDAAVLEKKRRIVEAALAKAKQKSAPAPTTKI